MMPQRRFAPYQFGFPQYGQQQRSTAYNSPGTSSATPAQGGGGDPTLQMLTPGIGGLALRKAFGADNGMTDQEAFKLGLKDNFGLDANNGIAPGELSPMQSYSGTTPGWYGGAEGAGASAEALDASSPYAASNLAAGGADAGLLGQMGAGTAYGADAGAMGAGATDAGLMGADLIGSGATGAAAADAGLLGAGAATAGEGAALAGGAAAAEGAVAATNFWNPVGWGAMALLAAQQLGLFD